MCNAFSCIVERTGTVHWKFGMNSHSDIVEMAGLDDLEADRSKLQFARVEITPRNSDYRHPDEWVLTIDEQATPTWWSPTHEVKCRRAHEQWCEQLYEILDCDTVIMDPFRDITPPEVTQEHIDLLHQWASIEANIEASIGASIEASIWASVRASVGASIGASIWDNIWDNIGAVASARVGASIWDNIEASVGANIEASIWASAGAQIGSLFRLRRSAWKFTENLPSNPEYPFQAAVDLWNMGLVPSYDGTTWRLHGGKDGRAMYEERIV